MKHIVIARDKETGKTRKFIFYGESLMEALIVEEIKEKKKKNY